MKKLKISLIQVVVLILFLLKNPIIIAQDLKLYQLDFVAWENKFNGSIRSFNSKKMEMDSLSVDSILKINKLEIKFINKVNYAGLVNFSSDSFEVQKYSITGLNHNNLRTINSSFVCSSELDDLISRNKTSFGYFFSKKGCRKSCYFFNILTTITDPNSYSTDWQYNFVLEID